MTDIRILTNPQDIEAAQIRARAAWLEAVGRSDLDHHLKAVSTWPPLLNCWWPLARNEEEAA